MATLAKHGPMRWAAAAVAACTLALTGCIALAGASQGDQRPAYKDPSQPIERRVEDLLARMTLEEKVAQMQSVWEHKDRIQTPAGDFSPERASGAFPHGLGQIARPSDRRGVAADANGPAGATAGQVNRNARETADYINAAQRWAVERTRLGIPLIMHEEALHGYVARDATSFPQSIALASSFDPAMVERIFNVASREMRARGANLALAPVVDVARDPRWGRIEETYGEDPHLVSEMSLAAIRGFQGTTLPLGRERVFVTLKHMTGHGQPESGTNIGPAPFGERTLREIFFPPFERAVRELPIRAVMPSYNEIDGVPSHANRWMLHDVLRQEWGFRGAIVSDYFAIREMVTRHRMFPDISDAAVAAMNATVDVETPDGEGYLHLPELVRQGRVSEARIDDAVRRILRMKFEAGLFENPYVDAAAADGLTATPDAVALARAAAARSIVLLRNENNLLPLDASRIRRMAVIGTHARDTPIGGYSDIPRHIVSVLEGMQAESRGRFQVDYAEGVRLTEQRIWAQDEVNLTPPEVNDRLRREAIETARGADTIVLVLGDNEQLSREAWADNHLGDRSSLDLVGPQEQLAREIFALGKPTVVILLNGRPLSVNYLAENAPALLEGWYLGQETGHGVADVVFGRVNPAGRLPVSIARNVGQLPVFYNRKPSARRGYLFDTTAPLYPFGFGLSYTSFEMSPPRLARRTIGTNDSVAVEVDVRNTGRRAGDEVVQLYVRDDAASVTRPLLELKRFQRVALRPGERRTVRFELTPADLSLWNLEMRRVVEPGTFTISVGPNSVDLESVTLTVR
ncbi:glycoside hydrolase family 3 N-terminal domain-containing protein [Sphingosinicella sp. LHD-64]|uniref:glycoside hydrolase family 3 N-terminal domain-containing protein n=1 Tax=Sphingosinicella sp. LHD-64 TaxID=3072139 RepID=UPI00280E49AD|nr:glycoside hydrolase family 3 N-terminal domain-containing protein [Sphingosinicella sp. LHD-64]MDQ8758098.1 glycoside hydrolase family 3 N-terminal domain-containing protein [Sphingosinicella sp. LHD-64]